MNYIQQYIFKKYSLYYFDLIDKMNGYQFTMRKDMVLKHNQNFKLDILNGNTKEKKERFNKECEVKINEKFMIEQKITVINDSNKFINEVPQIDEPNNK